MAVTGDFLVCRDEIYNFHQIEPLVGDWSVATSGQPTESQFRGIAADGYSWVVNLAPFDPTKGSLPDEAGLVEALGLGCAHIPVTWTAPLPDDFDRFVAVMDRVRGAKLLIHCVANLRATAFFSLYAMQSLGWSVAQADALMARFWRARPEYEAGGVWRLFVDERRREIVSAL